jgi:hypothetical protein
LLYIYCFFPLFSPVDPETAVDPEYDYVVNDPSFSAELPGKQTPLIISISPISLSPLLALEVATVVRYLLF